MRPRPRDCALAMVLTAFAVLLAACASGGQVAAAEDKDGCLKPTKGLKTTKQGESKVTLKFTTKSKDDMKVYWVGWDGGEVFLEALASDLGSTQETYTGHAFRVYTSEENDEDRVLLEELIVTRAEPKQDIHIEARPDCAPVGRNAGKLNAAEIEAKKAKKEAKKAKIRAQHEARVAEFEGLAEFDEGGEYKSCGPEGRSDLWSCTRRVERQACDARHRNVQSETGNNSFGFEKLQGKWKPGSYEDHAYNWQIPKIPRLSDGPGFLKMKMTKKLQDLLLPWYAEKVATPSGMREESPVPGGYLNDEWVKSGHVNLDRDYGRKMAVNKEMQEVLQWWTGGEELRHTATFGVRVYHRGNVLLNHVDRYDTHLVSVILQVHQEVDEDGGWPVEVLSEDRDCFEIYLQPGEMLLYEGAHFKHGRPMAFKGESFGNLFSHFAPRHWNGPGSDLNEL